MDIAYIFLIALAASFVGVSVGGSGLLIIPSLIFFGYSPKESIVALEIGAMAMMIVGGYRFQRAEGIDYNVAFKALAISLVGCVAGASLLVSVSSSLLQPFLCAALLLLLIFVWAGKEAGVVSDNIDSKDSKQTLGYLLFFPIGIWNGFVSAGVDFLLTYVFVGVFKKSFLQSAAINKVIGLGNGVVASGIFIAYGIVSWPITFAVASGMAVGSYIGSGYAIKKGNSWVKAIFSVVVVLYCLRVFVWG